MIDWKSVDGFFRFFVGLPQILLGLGLWTAGSAGSLVAALPLMLSCVIIPAIFHMAASSHNAAGIKRIQSWVFFVTSNATTIILILGWPAYSVKAFGIIIVGYAITWVLTEVFAKWARIRMNPIKRMYIGVGRNLGFLVPIVIFVVTVIGEAEISPFQSLAIAAFVFAFLYPVIMLASWAAILAFKISPTLYARRNTGGIGSAADGGWLEALQSSQPWGDLAVLTMVVGSIRRNRRVLALLALSLISLLSIIVTVPYRGAIGWLPVTVGCGMADALLVGHVVSYLRLDSSSLFQFMRP